MQVTVDYVYASEYGEDPRSVRYEIPDDTDLAAWVDEDLKDDEFWREHAALEARAAAKGGDPFEGW